MAEKFVDTISIFNRKRNSVKMNISGFAKIFHEHIDEILWKSGQHDIYSLLCAFPNRERGKGQRLSDVTWSLLLSVLYIFVTSLTDISELFYMGSLDIGTILLCVSSCQMQICANCPQVLWWPFEHTVWNHFHSPRK